jgi:hypothetical protein
VAQFGDNRAIWEAFLPGTEPNADQPKMVLDNAAPPTDPTHKSATCWLT